MRARERMLLRLQVLAVRDPEYKVGVAAGVWLDDLDAIEAEARAVALDEFESAMKGISLPPGPKFAWVEAHRPFITAALERIDELRGKP